MTDGADDGNRTIIVRPTPGRRQPNAVPAASGTPQEPRREVPVEPRREVPVEPRREVPAAPPSAPAPAAATDTIAAGAEALTVAAAPLLQLLARVHNTSHPPDPGDLREWAVRQVRIFEREADSSGVVPDLLRPAHYALCVSLDDVVLNTPWGSSGSWRAQPLVSIFHREAGGQERFFELLREMCNNPRKFLPVIKLMYLCLSLGFLGRYRAPGRGAGDIKRIRDDVYAIIVRQQREAEPTLAPHVKGVAASYRPTRARLPLWVAASAGLGVGAALFAWFALSLNADSDGLQARARDVPPDRMPTIARAPVTEPQPQPQPAARPLPPPEPTALDRVRDFLRPEIAQGLVEVTGTAAQPLIRVAASGAFATGSATVQNTFKPLLTRIGQALKGEPGKVRVIGYTDDQSIRTVAFPSNVHLSAARAQAAGTIIAAGIGEPSRVSSEGRGGAEPIAPNTTPEGRERNRRIEIVLSRQGP